VAIHVDRDLDALALGAIQGGADPARVLTHVEHNLAVDGAESLDVAHFTELVRLEIDGKLTATQAKTVLAEMVERGQAPEVIAKAHGFEAMDSSDLEAVVDGVIAANPDDWAEFVAADDKGKIKKLSGFFTGQIMAATKGQADGKAVNLLLNQRRSGV
jgi:Asp-tRNA(Asn)/Glu-tRNA(Gln) amidotransferase B subunit